jgi:maltose alpha-D-glucosyltransferase/alpha-amylase
LELTDTDLPPEAQILIPRYLQDVRLLGQRTAELHLALCQSSNPSLVPEPLTEFYRHSLYHSMIGLTNQSFQLLRSSLKNLPEVSQKEARLVLERANEVRSRFRSLRDSRMTAMRTRHHGDYHLGQVLFTGKDFVIIDFEGEPARPLSERRIKRSPLRDVAGMLRSFHYASAAALFGHVPGVIPGTQVQPVLESWAGLWYLWVSASFLKGYFATAGAAPFLPRSRDQLRVLIDAYLLEKAVYELAYELNNRPDWVRIPLRGILQLLEGEGARGA